MLVYEGPDRRKSDDMPGWAYQMQSDIRDIKTTLSLKLEPFAETCRKANEAYDIANQHEKVLKKIDSQSVWLQRAVWLIIIGAIASKVLGV